MNQRDTKAAFSEIVSKVLKHSGFPISSKIEMKSIEYSQFWELLNESDSDNAALFICELMKMIHRTEYDKKVKNYNLESLLSTLLTVGMFKKVEPVKRQRDYKENRTAWEHYLNTTKKLQMSNPYSISIMSNLNALIENQQQEENNFIGYLIGSIAFLPDLYKVAKPENIELMYDSIKQHYSLVESYSKTVRIKNDSFYNFLLDERFDLQETGEFMFGYEYLVKEIRVHKKNTIPRVYHDSIIKFFKMIPFIAQDFPEQAEKAALSLLHMTKQFTTFYNCETSELLPNLIKSIEIFRRWPYPVGVLASELVQILYQECKSRGNTLRVKFREEIPVIDFLDNVQGSFSASLHQSRNKEQMIPLQSQGQIQVATPPINLLQVFVFQDNRANEASNILQYAQNVLRESKNQLYPIIFSPHALRCYMCAFILGLQKKQQVNLSAFDEKYIFNLYCKLLIIIEKCDYLDSTQDIELIYANAFDEITKELKVIQNQMEAANNNNPIKEIQNILNENNCSIPDYPLYYFHQVPLKNFSFASPKIPTIPGQSIYPIAQVRQFIYQAFDNYMPLHTEPLRLLVVGGDEELFQISMLLGEIYDEKPMLLRSLDIRVYIAPSQSCALSQFLAVKDPWYQRYLYLPFIEDILIPKLDNIKDETTKQLNESSVNKDRAQLQLEQKAYALNTYLREANRAYNVRVYKLILWQRNIPGEGINIEQNHGLNPKITDDGIRSTIYFCSYVMFGAIAEFEKDKLRDEKFQKMTFYDYKEKNKCKFQNVPVKIKTNSTDMLGNIQEDSEQSVLLHNCKINNVYTNFFEGNMPMPHADWLELSYITQENAKLFDSGLRQKNIFKKHTQESIQNAFKSLFTNISVTKANIRLVDDQAKVFSVIIDGKIFNDVTQFEIESTQIKNEFLQKKFKDYDVNVEKNLNLPVMSFLPFKV